MSTGLKARNYLVLPQFITRQRAQALAISLAQHHAATPLMPDRLVPSSPAIYDFLPFVRLLVEKIPQIELAVEDNILPTYAYARIYGHGEALPLHEDRDACELSLTINLDTDEPWPIWLKTCDGETVSVVQEQGDALIYLGCQTPHWREPFNGKHCTQVFLHYVFSFGSRAYAYFDKQRIR
jgi:hypothetical protein